MRAKYSSEVDLKRAALECKSLLDAATPELFLLNAFRITGLSVDASAREIGKHADKLKIMAELGQGANDQRLASALKGSSSTDQIREALHKLRDPEKRLVDEFFWFWPFRNQEGSSDAAIQALNSGKHEMALSIWSAKESDPDDGVVALHNVAILWHMRAIDAEMNLLSSPALSTATIQGRDAAEGLFLAFIACVKKHARSNSADPSDERLMRSIEEKIGIPESNKNAFRNEVSEYLDALSLAGKSMSIDSNERLKVAIEDIVRDGDETWKTVEQYWRNAFKRWEHLVSDDYLWEVVTARAAQIDSSRLNADFVRGMRASLPEALDRIDAELALRHAEVGRTDRARKHIEFMRESNAGLDNTEKTAELVLAPAKTRLKEQIRRAKARAEKTPADGAIATRDLLEHARHTLSLFDLFFGKDSEVRNGLSDEVASLCNQLPVSYHQITGDDKTCLELLRAALAFATSIELRQQIEKNIGTLTENLDFKRLEPIYEILKRIQTSKDAPRSRLESFRRDAEPLLTKSSDLSVGADTVEELYNSAAVVLRGISLDAWNNHQDKTTAKSANERALELVREKEFRQRLLDDQAALRRISNQETITPSKSGAGWMIVLGIIIVIALARSCDSGKHSSSSGSTSKSTYRVSRGASTELDRDKREIESAKRRHEELSAELEDLERKIDRERVSLDRESQFAVDEFNRKVNRYNKMLEELRTQEQVINALVNDYNGKLRHYGR